jgi:uncharacterized tellurite resistance protein B-like protein
MIGDLFRRLTGASEAEPAGQMDARLAMAALLVRVARSDDSYTAVEAGQIEGILRENYDLDEAGAATLRGEAEQAEEEAPDTVQFTRLVKDAVPYEDRRSVVEALWRVAISDGIQAGERGFLRLVASLLGVSDQDSARARQRAQRVASG